MRTRSNQPISQERIALLRRAIERSGCASLEEFAREELVRDGRSVRYWLHGRYPIPNVVMPRLTKLARRRVRGEPSKMRTKAVRRAASEIGIATKKSDRRLAPTAQSA